MGGWGRGGDGQTRGAFTDRWGPGNDKPVVCEGYELVRYKTSVCCVSAIKELGWLRLGHDTTEMRFR